MRDRASLQPEGLDLLLSERAIQKLSYIYARGGDRIDPDLFASAFWPDGIWRQPGYDDRPICEIAPNLLQNFMNNLFSSTHHVNANHNIDFLTVDHAKSEVYFLAFHLTRPEITYTELESIVGATRLEEESYEPGRAYEVIVGGRYLDILERRGGIWKICERRLVIDYTTVRRGSGIFPDEGFNLFSEKMARDQNDSSYDL